MKTLFLCILGLAIPLLVSTQSRSPELSALLLRAATAPAAEVYKLALAARAYPLDAFEEDARAQLTSLLTPDQPQLREWILLAGFVGLEGPLRRLLAHEDLPRDFGQSIRLALARCGDQALLTQLMTRVRRLPLNDAFVYQVAPLLAYVRQPQSVGYLLEIILLDETNCTPADAETPGRIPCAYRLLELVAPVLDGFPLRIDPELGQLIPPDYPAAQQIARQWIQSRQGDYTLLRQAY